MNLVIPLLVCAAASSSSDPAVIATSAAHHGRLEGAAVVWSTHLHVSAPLTDGAWLPLLHPLPKGSVVVADDASAVFHDDGRLVGLRLGAFPSIRALRFEVPFRPADRLQAPLFGAPVERLSLEGLRFDPDDDLGLHAHLGYRAADTVHQRDRHKIEHVFGVPAREGSIYVTPTAALKGRGLVGDVVVLAEHRGRLALWALAATSALAAAMILAYRRLHAAVDAERVDKVLDGRLDELPT